MIEELKMIIEMVGTATTHALYAFIVYLLYKLGHLALIVLPVVHGVKYCIDRIFQAKPEK